MLDATDCDVLQQLTPKQQAAIDLLLSGKNDRETVEALAVHRTTISRWRLHDLSFVAELNRRRRELYGAAADRLQALLPRLPTIPTSTQGARKVISWPQRTMMAK